VLAPNSIRFASYSVSSRYTERLLAGELPSPEDWTDHLVAFYRVYDGVPPVGYDLFRTIDGLTSQEALIRKVLSAGALLRDILDVGCGDGQLLARFAETLPSLRSLTGIDVSGEQVARARVRLPAASLIHADAAKYDSGVEQYDAVLSHLSLMSIPATGAVLARSHAALRRGGMLAVVSEDPSGGGAIFEAVQKVLVALRRRFPIRTIAVPGRGPIHDDDALAALLREAGFSDISVTHLAMRATLTPAQLRNTVGLMYPLALIPRKALNEALDAIDVAVSFEAVSSLRLIVARQ
jgi:trans-aconitate methyltransferase